MLELSKLSRENWSRIRVLLTDIDDTITTDGRLTSQAYSALEALQQAGYIVIPVTGRCAGWCDHIARMWPVNAIVGENGAFYFSYDHNTKKMHQYFCQNKTEWVENTKKLQLIGADILKKVPGAGIASDQPYRITDFAIDFAEDVSPLPGDEVKKIASLAQAQGTTAKISSIHVNFWFGKHSKLTTSMLLLKEYFGVHDDVQNKVMFVGDSPNDETMFGYFKHSVGVANILENLAFEFSHPTYVTNHKGGAGFTEVVQYLLEAENITKPVESVG